MIQNSKKNKKIIGLTGGIATGKSTVSKYLITKGYIVIDADIIAREVVEIGKPAYQDIVKAFGEEILNSDCTINRPKLGEIIFKNIEYREKLNNIVHPRVTEEMKRKVEEYLENNKVVFLDIPLLIEGRSRIEDRGLKFDEVWLVYSDEMTQLERLMARDNLSREQAYNRINAQMSIKEKKKYADVIIDNSGDPENLKKILDMKLKKNR